MHNTATMPARARVDQATADRRIALWLLAVSAMVFAMVVVGGITRLTESGLSIVTWKPLSGVVPPLTDADWQAEFEAYKQYPEYQKVNRGMTLDEFKKIFWWEYAHRLLGRSIGLAFAIPLAVFWIRGYVRRELRVRLVGLFLLGGLQGLMGWYMVKSGLVDRPDVSHYRLTAHLSLAIIIYSALMWVALGLLRPETGTPSLKARRPDLWRLFLVLVGLTALQIGLGGFVAGLNAGMVYNTWPLMGGGFIPGDLLFMDPWWVNFLEHTTTVQFSHRMIAYAVVVTAAVLWWRLRVTGVADAANLVLAAVLIQLVLGILTLVYVVPIPLAALHQAGAMVLVTAILYLGHRMVRS
ncbi:MAG: heme A synthase [Alphaproteobacteria bacterium]|nr:MAG: heme A synthase [Alphaproteobacteria bacterium]